MRHELEKYTGFCCLQMGWQDTRKMFKQAPQTGYVQHENYEIMLRAEVEERCANASEKTPSWSR